MIKINNFRGELTDISAIKEALIVVCIGILLSSSPVDVSNYYQAMIFKL